MTLLMPSADDQSAAAASAAQLERLAPLDGAEAELSFFVAGERRTLKLPAMALKMLAETMVHLARGNAITIAPVHMELTTQQAADILGVSRPYLVKLLEEGKIPFRRPHNHRRVRLQELLEFKEREDALRQRALDELTELSEEMGLYD